MLQYINTDSVSTHDTLVQSIDDTVVSVNKREEWVNKMFSEDWVLHDTENKAFRRGRREGRAEGEARGKAEGLAEGEARFSMLAINLFENKRMGDFQRALADENVRKDLYAEFGL